MKQKLIIALAALMVLPSCLKDRNGEQVPKGGTEQEVEIMLSAEGKTRADSTSEGTPDENIVEELDLLVFDASGFKLWRSAYKVSDSFRATLPVSQSLDVYFLANCRGILDKLYTDNQLTIGLSWDQLRLRLVDTDPSRFIVASGFENLPMWGRLLNQAVEDVPVNKWGTVSLLRSVASVDVYVDPGVDNFTMEDLTLYFVPDNGFLAPRTANYNPAGPNVYDAESPADMETTLTLFSDRYDATNLCIANKLYLYDNSTHSGNRTPLPDVTHRHTRLVVGGVYKGNKYYYPIDFATKYDSLNMIKRNWKYVFTVNSVTSQGYTDPGTASTEPMVGLDLDIVEWNVEGESDFWVSGPYYLGVNKRAVTLSRTAFSTDAVTMRSNILSDNITLAFETDKNGVAAPSGGGIANDRFLVEKVKDGTGYITSLKVTALGGYSSTASENTDVVILTSGRIEVRIAITQINGSTTDWDNGGNVGDGEGIL